ncbi:MAG: hypothetical protein RLZZ74_2221, partial [Cyanobacteriota bacterium]
MAQSAQPNDFFWSAPNLSLASFVANNATVIGNVSVAEG